MISFRLAISLVNHDQATVLSIVLDFVLCLVDVALEFIRFFMYSDVIKKVLSFFLFLSLRLRQCPYFCCLGFCLRHMRGNGARHISRARSMMPTDVL